MLFEWLDSNVQKLRWYDISLVKLSVMAATLFLLTAFEGLQALLRVAWYWYLLIMLVLSIPVMVKLFR